MFCLKGGERRREDWKGLSRNYIPVFLEDNDEYGKRKLGQSGDNVVVTGLAEKGVMGRDRGGVSRG